MRVFFAVELPEALRAALGEYQREVAGSGADVKWVERANLHVTMRFLGETSEQQIEGIRARLEVIGRGTPAFEAQLSQPGAFPSVRSPRVIWMGIGAGHDALERLAARIEESLRASGVAPEERSFVAHVTLGRVRSRRGVDRLSRRMAEASWSAPAPFVVDHMTLFQSRLSNAGPTYIPLARVPLTGHR